MAFIDDLSAKLNRAGNAAVQKTQEVTELARLNGQINTDNQKIQSIFTQIGNLYFRKFKNNPDPDFRKYISEIISLEKDLEGCQNRILEIKSLILCPNCHAAIAAGSVFCSECGVRVDQPSLHESSRSLTCPNCHTVLAPGIKFCPKCGINVQSMPSTDEIRLNESEN